MPTYCYRTAEGEIVDRVFPFGEAPGEVEVDGARAVRDLRAELAGSTISVRAGSGRHSKAAWPMTCYASGVHPDQAGELRDYLRKRGVPTEVNRNGDPVYESATHQKKALAVRGMNVRNSFC